MYVRHALRRSLLGVILSGAIATVAVLDGCRSSTKAAEEKPAVPAVTRQLRGIFVTTAYNLDWPSRPGLHPRVMTDEIHAIVDRAKELNCNTIFLQVRAFGDTIYRAPATQATTEPWAVSLNDRNDPDPHEKDRREYDPLKEWIRICHQAGIEVHAWVNPFRTDHYIKYKKGENEYYYPMIVVGQERRELYLDPRSPLVQEYVKGVIDDILRHTTEVAVKSKDAPGTGDHIGGAVNPDIESLDGLAFDHNLPDPTPRQPPPSSGPSQRGGSSMLPSALSPALAATLQISVGAGQDSGKPATKRTRFDWMKDQAATRPHRDPDEKLDIPDPIDRFVKDVSTLVRAKYPWMKFGVSPMVANLEFDKDDKAGLGQAENQARGWMKKRVVNYVIPEFYTQRTDDVTDFKGKLQRWCKDIPEDDDEKAKRVRPIVLSGHFATRVQVPDPKRLDEHKEDYFIKTDEFHRQVEFSAGEGNFEADKAGKKKAPGGQAHYSYSALKSPAQGGTRDARENAGEELKKLYDKPALVPQCVVPPDETVLAALVLSVGNDDGTPIVKWRYPDDKNDSELRFVAIWTKAGTTWSDVAVIDRTQKYYPVKGADSVRVVGIDRYNREGEPAVIPVR